MYIKLNRAMKIVAFVFAGLEALLLSGQITTLVSTYWTSWDLRFNWTQTGGELNRRPSPDGQLLSQGHAGLWSRCVKVYSTGKDGEKAKISADQCMNNYEGNNTTVSYTFGKACKTATAALCLAEVAVTLVLLVIVLVSIFWSRGHRIMKKVPLPLLLLQGLIFFIIPITYLSGNMSELIEQLSAAYGLLLIVGMDAGYAHDWAFWTQAGLSALWIIAAGVYVIVYDRVHRMLQHSDVRTNGTKSSETTEMQPLRNER